MHIFIHKVRQTQFFQYTDTFPTYPANPLSFQALAIHNVGSLSTTGGCTQEELHKVGREGKVVFYYYYSLGIWEGVEGTAYGVPVMPADALASVSDGGRGVLG